MKKIFLDIETRNDFRDVGSADPAALDLSVVCIYDSEDSSYHTYEEEELENLWPLLESANLLIGFNCDHFDIPILNKYYRGDLKRIRTIDLLKEIKRALGRRLKLDSVAEATLGRRKTGHGLEAIEWWHTGQKEKVKHYCLEDVKITKELYEFALIHRKLRYKDNGIIKDIPLNTKPWETKEESAATATLPF